MRVGDLATAYKPNPGSLPNGAEIRFKSNESAGQTALASAAGVVPLRVLLPDPTVFALDDEFGFLVFRQLSSALDGVGLAAVERVRARGAVRLDRPTTIGARFDRDLRLSSHGVPSKIEARRPIGTVHPEAASHKGDRALKACAGRRVGRLCHKLDLTDALSM